MTIIFSDCIVNTDLYNIIYTKDKQLLLEDTTGAHAINDVPSDALQRIAVAKAEGKSYIEMEGTLDI